MALLIHLYTVVFTDNLLYQQYSHPCLHLIIFLKLVYFPILTLPREVVLGQTVELISIIFIEAS